MKTNWIKSLTTGLVAALIAPTCACASQLTNKSPLRAVSSLSADSGLKIDFQNRSGFEFQALGGGIDGSGGGSVIKCVVGGKDQYTLLDYQEGAQRQLQVDLGPKSLSVEAKIEKVLGNLATINPDRARYYAKLVNAYKDNVDMRVGVNFGKTPDVVDEIIPKGCERVQVVIQINPELPGDKRFVTNADIWKVLDNNTKAGIILHEISYYDQGMFSARKLRYFNAVLASQNLLSMNLKEYYDLLVATSMIGETGYNVTANSICKGDATFESEDEVGYATQCQINEKNFHVGKWGEYFSWMSGTADLTVLALPDLLGKSMTVHPDTNTAEIRIGEIKIQWSHSEEYKVRDFKKYDQIESGGSLEYIPDPSRELYKKGTWRRSLFALKTIGGTIKVTTNKASASFEYPNGGRSCPEGYSLDSNLDDIHILQILKSKVVLAYSCEPENSGLANKTMYIELAR